MTSRKKGRGINQTGRSKGGGRFVAMPHDMLKSVAWKALSGTAAKVYLLLLTRYNGGNGDQLKLSAREVEAELGMGRATASWAFKELEQLGFIVVRRRGQWYGKLATIYAATIHLAHDDPAAKSRSLAGKCGSAEKAGRQRLA